MPDRIRELNADLGPAVSFALREITHICRDMKKRAPGSEGEREAAEYMAKSLEKDCGCTDVRVETFKGNTRLLFTAISIFQQPSIRSAL